jgi:hypothetical protein
MKNITYAFVCLMLASASASFAATETPPETPSEKSTVKSAEKSATLAERYKVPEQDVKDLRDKGMGWGEIDTALAIAQKSGKPVSEIMAMRDKGMGWGKIAKENGFKLGDIKGHRGMREPRGEKHEGRGPKEGHGKR